MKIIIISSILNLLFMTSCASESDKTQDTTTDNTIKNEIHWFPYLTNKGDYVYVDRKLNRPIKQSFAYAEPFLPTGYAIVGDRDRRNAVIDSGGNLVQDYTEHVIDLSAVGDITLMRMVREYEKKMPIWKWEWNIMGGGVRKEQTYHQVQIRVLETGQTILSEDVPYDEDSFSLHHVVLDENHIVLNDVLYEIKHRKLKKLNKAMTYSLDQSRYIPYASGQFSIYKAGEKQALLSNLSGTTQLHVRVNNQPFLLDSINQDRYAPLVPKLLQDTKHDEIYVFPQYDKAFPKQIQQATAAQIAFLKDVSLVYSINNSPYFILGRFNYDHDVWAFDWLYLDQQGNLLDKVEVTGFYILDQVNYLVWPDRYMLFSEKELQKDLGKRKAQVVHQSDKLYIVKTQRENEEPKEGLWNAESQEWDIQPDYHSLKVLDGARQIFAIQKEHNGNYSLFNNSTKSTYGVNTYKNIYTNGLVHLADDKEAYFYIDILTGKEYRD